MYHRLSMIFEEDLFMQDNIDNFVGIIDESDDLIVSIIEDRAQDKSLNKKYLFPDMQYESVNKDGLTKDEESQIQVANLNKLYEDDIDDIIIQEDTL